MTNGAGDNDVEVQYCMALAHQILESVHFPAVTNARSVSAHTRGESMF